VPRIKVKGANQNRFSVLLGISRSIEKGFSRMKETIEMIVKTLVDDAAAVDVREIERDKTTSIIEVRVAETDMGKLIGRQGRTVRALRVLMRAASIKQNHRFMLEIIE